MSRKQVLLMHISNVSGHRCASLAIERALRNLDSQVQTHCINIFSYLSPTLERFINTLYMSVIQAAPRVWEYLYDNEDIYRKARILRTLIHKTNDKKIRKVFSEFQPDVVACTQAFPCGIVADYKRRHNLNITLLGVLTDYAPHLYWLDDSVDIYVVPSENVKQRLLLRGVPEERLRTLGIPIDIKFMQQNNREATFAKLGLDLQTPAVLIMGGGQGLGPIKEIVRSLDKLVSPVQLIVACGTNRSLYKWLKANSAEFSKPLTIVGYTEHIDELMAVASLIVTKPGGLTLAEALSKSLPIIIVNPLAGQEIQNTQFLLDANVALKAKNTLELPLLVEGLLSDNEKLQQLRERANSFARADSSLNIAQLILKSIR